jgi:hypothetical protein
MGDVKVTDRGAVPDIGPGCLPDQSEIDALRGGETFLACDHQQEAVEQRHETSGDAMFGHILKAPASRPR